MAFTEAGPRQAYSFQQNFYSQPRMESSDGFTGAKKEFTARPTEPSSNTIQSLIDVDLQQLANLQQQFDRALGRQYDPKDLLQRSYNPVIDVFHIKQRREKGDERGEAAYMDEISLNMETNLRERYKIAASSVNYSIDGKDVYSELFPHEPFSIVLDRGVQYRLQHNTPEPEREGVLGEQSGWQKIQKKLVNPETKVGTKMTAFSPRGLADETAYTGNFVDEYELAVNEKGDRYIKLTRMAVDFDQADFDQAALVLDPEYFEGVDDRPWDAWMLSHPLEGSIKGLEESRKKEDSFVPDLTSGKLMSFLNYYKAALRAEPVDYTQIALAFNAILNESDEQHEAYKRGDKLPSSYEMPISANAIRSEIDMKGRQEVKTIAGGGCPPNKGFNVAQLVGLGSAEISVREGGAAQFSAKGIGQEKTLHCKSCPKCGALEIDATIRGGQIICPVNGCSAPYAC